MLNKAHPRIPRFNEAILVSAFWLAYVETQATGSFDLRYDFGHPEGSIPRIHTNVQHPHV